MAGYASSSAPPTRALEPAVGATSSRLRRSTSGRRNAKPVTSPDSEICRPVMGTRFSRTCRVVEQID